MDQGKQKSRGRWKLLLVIAICASPLIASYFTYYVIKPEQRTNYGTLLDPRAHPMAKLNAKTLDGQPTELDALRGKWIMLRTGPGACDEACRQQLYYMRQLRTAQGKDRDRIERVWLVSDDEPLETVLMREYDGTHMLRANAQAVQAWLPTEADTAHSDHLYLIDPLGNLMMRFPKDFDPNKVKKDLSRLLKASRIG